MSYTAHVILDALEQAAWSLVDTGELDRSAFDNVPQSHVFYPEPGEPWDEDDVAAIQAVGEQDVNAKIAYWRTVLDNVGTD